MSVQVGTEFDDTLTVDADSDNTIFGDPIDTFSPRGNDHLTGGSNSTNLMSGDVEFLPAGPPGGADVLIGGESSTNRMFGDATGSFEFANGGDDVLTGGNDSVNIMSGDAGGDLEPLFAHGVNSSFGGNDTLVGGARSANTMFGDATGSFLASFGGDDVLTGGNDSVNIMSGDAGGDLESVPERGHLRRSIGGDDTLVGGERSANTMFGDAAGAIVSSFGGDDTLIAGDGGTNTMIGDALVLADEGFGGSTGGDDLLVSGTGTDDMWGDAKQVLDGSAGGHDVFRFLADNGNDTIHDFERGKDLIEVNASLLPPANAGTGARLAALAALVPSDLGKLTIEEGDANNDDTTDSIIHLDAKNSVTVLGVTGLTSEDIVAAPGTSYVLFGRTAAPIGTRDKWLGSEGNSQASHTPGSGFRGSAFNADTATAAGTVLAGAGFADYVADGILTNANVAMFDLTESPLGVFATGAAADLETKIASSTPLFGGAKTDLDPANSNIDPATGELHLAQTDADWNGIKNIEVSLDSTTSLRDIRLENFVDTRVKIGDASPVPGTPDGAVFDVALLGTKRGEVDASHAPAAIALTLDVWTNNGTFQNSFDIKGSVFDDVVTIGPGEVGTLSSESPWYIPGVGLGALYTGVFTTVSANLGAGDDQYDTFTDFIFGGIAGYFSPRDVVWGASGDDSIKTGYGDDRVFGDNGSGAWLNLDPLAVGGQPGNDRLDGGAGKDWLEGNGDAGEVVIRLINGATRFLDLSTQGDVIDCGRFPTHKGPQFPTDADRDIVNFNAGDGFDVVFKFGAAPSFADDVLRIENVGTLTTEVVSSSEGLGTLVQNGAGSVFLVGVTTPLTHVVSGNYLLVFDAT